MPEVAPAPAPNRGHRRRERTRASLIGAARQVFAARGIAAATVQEITDTADVAKGSFYNHFASHEEILRAVVADALEHLGTNLDRRVGGREADPARVVAQSLYASLRTCVDDPVLGGFVLRGAEAVDVADAVLGKRARRDLAAGMQSGRFLVADLDLVITALAGAVEAVLRKRLRGDLSAAAEGELIGLVLRFLGIGEKETRLIVTQTLAGTAERRE